MEFIRRFGLISISRPWRRPPRNAIISRYKHHVRFNSTVPALPGSGIVLRDYQEECIQSVLTYLDQGHRRLGISLATGSGKTVIFTQLISRVPARDARGTKTMIIVHRRELVEQAVKHCRLAYPSKIVEIEMGNNVATGHGDIIIASVQTLARGRIAKFDPAWFKLILVDEAHHIVARSYRDVLGHFSLNEPSQNAPVLVGVSATFARFDGLKLGAAIDHIVYHKDYVDMIGESWLTNAVFTTVKSEANLSNVKKDKFGDFALSSLSEAVNTSITNNITVRAWMANARDRKSTLVFCVDVAHVRQLTATFREHGVDARYITAATPKNVRAEQLEAFKNREFPVLLNCGLFTEGTDIPNIDCVLLARPTRSRNLLIQMIGRGLRLFPGKENCHIIDMVASLATGVLSTPTLFGLHPDEVLNKSSVEEIRKEREEPDLAESPQESQAISTSDSDINLEFTHYDSVYDLLDDTKFEKHIRSLSPNSWVRIGNDKYLLSDATGWLTLEREGDVFNVQHVMKFTNPMTETPQFTRPRTIASGPNLETAVRAADTYASSKFDERYIASWKPWRQSPATSGQIKLLNKAHIRQGGLRPQDLTRGQAADIIVKLKFGGKKRFKEIESRRRKEERKEQALNELRSRTDVRVGPLKG
ncbi:ATP-dependent helicase IRC3 [Penicillium macrosclerotiorum]|uniref:ATP-dependent helicase IRC3 n=1 Tax=Penicillium macrosclerotiorum TaxID=303699 RepID=UPI0025481EC7|nr:ATP-dependent helicase IRC3 [Penicillium macrosclerotiorum]KAJ5689618.1 ATP-dependent helicase IRC3 [Penicillium macrosclerotiorum]